MLQDVYGRPWPEFRRYYQSHLLATQQSDLVFWNNLIYLHAGFDGSRTRLLEPIGFVVDHPVGSQYEEWLRAIWRTAVDGKATSSTIAVGRDRDATDTIAFGETSTIC
jgi:hypothetical protein